MKMFCTARKQSALKSQHQAYGIVSHDTHRGWWVPCRTAGKSQMIFLTCCWERAIRLLT